MGTHVSGTALERSTGTTDFRSVPQTGDVLASARTARADVYTIRIIPTTALLTATRHSAALDKVRELARALAIDGWFTCNHPHDARVANFRDASGHDTNRLRW